MVSTIDMDCCGGEYSSIYTPRRQSFGRLDASPHPAPLEQLDRGAQAGIVGRHRKTRDGSAQRGPGLCQFELMCVTKIVLGVADPGQDGWSRTSTAPK